ncbi:MAG: hypothetical protein RI935_347 [Candidatus Parcubacteria bacterium]
MKKIISIVTLLTLGATTVSYASIDKNLKYGQRDKEVTELQEFLIDKGLLKTTPSTYFGLLTFKAVKAYQTSVGLPATGFVGALTREKINKEIDAVIASSNEAEKAETGFGTNQNTNTTPTTQAVANNTQASSSDSIYDTDIKYDSLGRKIIITQSPNYKVVNYVTASLVDTNGKLVNGFFYKNQKLFISNEEIEIKNNQIRNIDNSPKMVVDICKNIEGIQSYVPSGMSVDSYGNCLTTQNTTSQQSVTNNQTSLNQNEKLTEECKYWSGPLIPKINNIYVIPAELKDGDKKTGPTISAKIGDVLVLEGINFRNTSPACDKFIWEIRQKISLRANGSNSDSMQKPSFISQDGSVMKFTLIDKGTFENFQLYTASGDVSFYSDSKLIVESRFGN